MARTVLSDLDVAQAPTYLGNMPIPTGPAQVGLELVVLPACVTLEEDDLYDVVAPQCRYGHALYLPAVVGPDYEEEADDFYQVESGSSSICDVPPGMSVELRLVTLSLRPGAFDHLLPEELVPTLRHPFAWVREAALLALRRC